MKKKNVKKIWILAGFAGLLLVQGVCAGVMEDKPIYTIWAVDDQGNDLYAYTLEEDGTAMSLTPVLEGEITGVDGPKDIEAFTIDSAGGMWLINNSPAQNPRESTLYFIDPAGLDNDPDTGVAVRKIGATGLRAETNNEITNLQFITIDGETGLYGITKKLKRVYKIDTATGNATFVADINTGSTNFRRTDAMTQGVDGTVYINDTDNRKILKFDSGFPNGTLVEVADISGVGKVEALTAHPNGYLYFADGDNWYRLWPDAPDNQNPVMHLECPFSFGTEGMDFWFHIESVKLAEQGGSTGGGVVITPDPSDISDVANEDGGVVESLNEKWLGTGADPANSWLGIRIHGFPTGNIEVDSANLVITNNHHTQWIQVTAQAFAELATSPAPFSADNPPSARTLTSVFSVYDRNIKVKQGETWTIDMTDPIRELVEAGLAGETVSIVIKGAGSRWGRVFFYNTDPEVVRLEVTYHEIPQAVDTDEDGIPDDVENASCTDPYDADTDDDGIPDGVEDASQDGIRDSGETDPCNADTDQDGIQDGTESGYTLDIIGEDTDTSVFKPDEYPPITSDPLNPDTDGDGMIDGDEDVNANGHVDLGESDPTTFWTWISDWDAEKLVSFNGMLIGDFGTKGLYSFAGESWTWLSEWDAQEMAVSGGRLYVDFGANGLYSHDGTQWTWISDWDAQSITSYGSGIGVDFGTNGTYIYDGTQFTWISDWDPDAMVPFGEYMAVDFGANGLFFYNSTGWEWISAWDAEDMAYWNGKLAVDFGGYGTFYHDGTAWTWISSWDPQGFAPFGARIGVDYGAYGTYYHDGNDWTWVSSWDASAMGGWDLNLAAGFGEYGTYIHNEGSNWTWISSWQPSKIVAWDADRLGVVYPGEGTFIYDRVNQ